MNNQNEPFIFTVPGLSGLFVAAVTPYEFRVVFEVSANASDTTTIENLTLVLQLYPPSWWVRQMSMPQRHLQEWLRQSEYGMLAGLVTTLRIEEAKRVLKEHPDWVNGKRSQLLRIQQP